VAGDFSAFRGRFLRRFLGSDVLGVVFDGEDVVFCVVKMVF
jgi:hypothetical protein